MWAYCILQLNENCHHSTKKKTFLITFILPHFKSRSVYFFFIFLFLIVSFLFWELKLYNCLMFLFFENLSSVSENIRKDEGGSPSLKDVSWNRRKIIVSNFSFSHYMWVYILLYDLFKQNHFIFRFALYKTCLFKKYIYIAILTYCIFALDGNSIQDVFGSILVI